MFDKLKGLHNKVFSVFPNFQPYFVNQPIRAHQIRFIFDLLLFTVGANDGRIYS